jgi:hypothetical protein
MGCGVNLEGENISLNCESISCDIKKTI